VIIDEIEKYNTLPVGWIWEAEIVERLGKVSTGKRANDISQVFCDAGKELDPLAFVAFPVAEGLKGLLIRQKWRASAEFKISKEKL
jgi:hypothetical protein